MNADNSIFRDRFEKCLVKTDLMLGEENTSMQLYCSVLQETPYKISPPKIAL